MDIRLLPCPFCGGTDTLILPHKYWTGAKYTVLSVDIRHYCGDVRGQFNSVLTIRAKNEEEAINKWNSRVGTYA